MAENDFNFTPNYGLSSSSRNYLDKVMSDPTNFNFGGFNLGTEFDTENVNSTSGFQPDFLDKLLGWKDPTNKIQHAGWGMPALNAIGGLAQSWIGMKQLDLAKKAFAEQKRQFDLNWNAQKKNYNSELEWRQKARVATDPTAQDVTSYMSKWGI